MNISFEYLYRDGANYKNWGEVILPCASDSKIDDIDSRLRETLIDGLAFVAEDANVPTLYFSRRDNSIDHGWHEFFQVSWTDEKVTDERTIEELIMQLSTQKKYR